jgi:hypothetical protein
MKCQNCDDTEEEELEALADPSKPWLWEWNIYLEMHESIPDDMGIVHWWGVHLF